MLWLIQNAKFKEHGVEAIHQYIIEKGIDYRLVKTPAFTDVIVDGSVDFTEFKDDINLIPQLEIDNDKQVMTIGSYSLAKAAVKRGWTPGAFINENFEFSKWLAGWGEHNLLNGKAIESTIRNTKVPEDWHKLFARPSEDTKFFSGSVFERGNFIFWLNQIIENGEEADSETEIIIAPLVEINAEYRLFVVDGVIVTGSLYKLKDKVMYSPFIDEDALDFAKKMIAIWQPDRAFVLDIALTPNGAKIIEVNNINSSGLYAIDIPAFVDAIENMKF